MMKVLIAEKDPNLRYLIAERLKVRGYEVFETSESLETIHVLDRERVDLILVSEDMERMGAVLLVEAIRKRPHLTSVPIILITREENISELVMSRERGYDDFLTKPFNAFVLALRVAINIERSRHRAEANALTYLPGNHAIEKVVKKKIEKGESFSVLYIDISNFKAFNDYYSFEKGDDVIRQTAKMLVKTAEQITRQGDVFVGHIGGDDFIVVISPEHEEKFARAFIHAFDKIMPTYYTEEDQKRGSIRVTNRRGKKESFPIMACSVAACNNVYKVYKSLGEVARDAMEVKAFLKSQVGSNYLRDRRTEPAKPVEDAARLLTPGIELEKEEELAPLGQLLLQAKLITSDQLSIALKKHLQTGLKLGQVLTAMKAVRSEDVGKILERKLKVPYLSMKTFIPSQEALNLMPRDFMRLHRVVPLQKTERGLKVGICDPLDKQTLDMVKKMTHLKPIPVLVLEDELEEFWSRGVSTTGQSLSQEYSL